MCGIVAAIAKRNITDILLEGLQRLEYRGYDSAGIAILDEGQSLQRYRTEGKVKELLELVDSKKCIGHIGIAHTRWATHGKPNERNAHPHVSGEKISLVHNGIIENHQELKILLKEKGYEFDSQTDTEVIAHLIADYLTKGNDFLKAVTCATKHLSGAFALGVINSDEPDVLVAVRKGSPLVVGLGFGENFIASDHLALLPVTQKFIYLEEGDIALLKHDNVLIFDKDGKQTERPVHKSKHNLGDVDKGAHRHFMYKEILQQPEVIAETLEGRLSDTAVMRGIFGVNAKDIFENTKTIQIVACGTSYHAGLVARYMMEDMARLPCRVDVASEFRYRKQVVLPGTLLIVISQSGETADTLAALRKSKELGYLASLAICNVPGSAIVRESELVLMTRAGVEIGVASTKAFTTQLVALELLMLVLAQQKLDKDQSAQMVSSLKTLPDILNQVLALDANIQHLAKSLADKNHALFVARGMHYPIAMEGALKLKEISYIHAEAYPAGELKHGPLALVDHTMPVIAIAPNNDLFEKMASNLYEIQARDGQLIILTNVPEQFSYMDGKNMIVLPTVPEQLAPIVYTIPLQLLAYYVAVQKGTDVDQPRNLAKSVTVE